MHMIVEGITAHFPIFFQITRILSDNVADLIIANVEEDIVRLSKIQLPTDGSISFLDRITAGLVADVNESYDSEILVDAEHPSR